MASPMETQLWAIAVKKGAIDEFALQTTTAGLADLSGFQVPEGLRVGTLDSLMSLSDDLVKLDQIAEATTMKVYRQYMELTGVEPTCDGVSLEQKAKKFYWDEAKFQVTTQLRELSENISGRIAGIDEELKLKLAEVNTLKGYIQTYERKTQGNLMVRSLMGLIPSTGPSKPVNSEWMTTVFVVVPKLMYKEWYETYEKLGVAAIPTGAKLTQYVVPGSGTLLYEDPEYGLFRVVVFKKGAEEFKTAAREKRYTVREYDTKEGQEEEEKAAKEKNVEDSKKLVELLKNWCGINFSESYINMMHLKVIRVFVESVLRYGIGERGTPSFKALIIHPKRGKTDALRKALAAKLGGSSAMLEGDDGETAVPGAGGEFFPYVSVSIETAPTMV